MQSLDKDPPSPGLAPLRGEELAPGTLTQLARGMLSDGIPILLTASGSSMSPLIKGGDRITLEPAGTASIHPGHVVAFINASTNRLTVHRVIAEQGERFLLKGDNALDTEGWVLRKDIVGYVTFVERKRRRKRLNSGIAGRLLATLSRWGVLTPILGILWKGVGALGRRNR